MLCPSCNTETGSNSAFVRTAAQIQRQEPLLRFLSNKTAYRRLLPARSHISLLFRQLFFWRWSHIIGARLCASTPGSPSSLGSL
jgi:hypothetical protein